MPIAELESVFAELLAGTPWNLVAQRYLRQPAAPR